MCLDEIKPPSVSDSISVFFLFWRFIRWKKKEGHMEECVSFSCSTSIKIWASINLLVLFLFSFVCVCAAVVGWSVGRSVELLRIDREIREEEKKTWSTVTELTLSEKRSSAIAPE